MRASPLVDLGVSTIKRGANEATHTSNKNEKIQLPDRIVASFTLKREELAKREHRRIIGMPKKRVCSFDHVQRKHCGHSTKKTAPSKSSRPERCSFL